ncbi:hypothetical protein [Streptomyces graminilatus]|uniref:hypothetical protein n=1 Tax=Streptomyces graminilatus TaxID=1464070 RepID=UPI0012FE9AEC|nr:hypothetical protein [Streptomyces graminilatus]
MAITLLVLAASFFMLVESFSAICQWAAESGGSRQILTAGKLSGHPLPIGADNL